MEKSCPFGRIIVGDFNGQCETTTPIGQWVQNWNLSSPQIGHTWAEPGNSLQLDHIFFNANHLVAHASYTTMTEEDAKEGLPNSRCPSDHLPVCCIFSFKE